ncbi:MAG: DUF4038 domain-containing protein [bacterium]|nr:DUF4038 domain-containing protein [bacterium]
MRTQTNAIAEIAFTSTAAYDDPYNETELDIILTSPRGTERRIPAFWAGDGTWRVRLSSPEEGAHTFRTECSNAGDAGLHDQHGTLEVAPYTGPNPLLKHGRMRVAEDKRHFEHTDGTPFFWLGDTWWMGLSTRLDWPDGVKELAADRVQKGYNVIQIVAGPYPDMDVTDARGCNEAGLPFEADFARINAAYYDAADKKIAYLVDNGLMPCIVGMWGYYLPQLGVDRAKRFWRHLVARYSAYPVAWCICGEAGMAYYLSENRKADETFQKHGWSEVTRYVRDIDGYDNTITIHPTQYGRDQVDDPAILDFEMLQTGHSDLDSVPNTAASMAKSVAREPVMPVIDSEVNYEGILGRCWQNVQRLCFYHSVLNGAAGHTYGANGIWQMSTEAEPYGPSPHGRCWGNTPWREAAQLPGSRQVGHGGVLMRQFPWWQLESHPEWVGAEPGDTNAYAPRAVGIPGKLRIVYVPLLWDPPTIRDLEPNAAYTAWYFDPCTGQRTDLGPVTPDADGTWTPPLPPEVHDWVVVLEGGRLRIQDGPARMGANSERMKAGPGVI